jgi:hypothetical protein
MRPDKKIDFHRMMSAVQPVAASAVEIELIPDAQQIVADLDKDYLEQRAETELAMAQASSHPAVVRAHYMLAGYYLDRLYCSDGADVVRSGNADWPGQGRY